MRNQPTDDDRQMRRYVLETRTELPHLASKPRHIHNADYIDGDLCPCEDCRRHLCGYVAQEWHPEDPRIGRAC